MAEQPAKIIKRWLEGKKTVTENEVLQKIKDLGAQDPQSRFAVLKDLGVFKGVKIVKDPYSPFSPMFVREKPGQKPWLQWGNYPDGERFQMSQQTLDDALDVSNYLKRNKDVETLNELSIRLNHTTPSGHENPGRTRAALFTAKNTPSLAEGLEDIEWTKDLRDANTKRKIGEGYEFRGNKFVKENPKLPSKLYPNYNMVIDTLVQYEDLKNPEHFDWQNMKHYYKVNPLVEKGLTTPIKTRIWHQLGEQGYGPADKKYITAEVSKRLGRPYTMDDYNAAAFAAKERLLETKTLSQRATVMKPIQDEVKKLYDDNKLMRILKGDLTSRSAQTKAMHRAMKVLELDKKQDAAHAMRRLYYVGMALDGRDRIRRVDGIEFNPALGKKILDTGSRGFNNQYAMMRPLYDFYAGVIDDALKSPETRRFGPYYQTKLRGLLDKGMNVDEIFSVTASGRRGLEPYAIFAQKLRADVNSRMKGGNIDGALSIKHRQMQNIFKGRKWNQLLPKDKRAALELVETFEKTKRDALNKPLNPSEVRKGAKPIYLTRAEKEAIHLPEFDLRNPPEKAIKRWGDYDANLQKAFTTSYDTVGYSMKVPKGVQSQRELLKFLQKGTTKGPLPLKAAAGTGLLAFMGYEAMQNLFPGTDTNNLTTAGISGGTTIPKVDLVPGTVVDEQVTEVAEAPTTDQMTYNSITGEFDNAEGDPETQEGILNWIADHPVYSGLAPIPIGIGAGLGAEAMNAPKVGEFFKSMKFILPPAYAAEKLHQYKRGDDMGQMFANPIDAVWAMALDTKDSRNLKWEHYKNLAKTRPGWGAAAATKVGEKAAIEAEQLGLHPRTWKNIGRAITAPASRGTRLVFPFATEKYGFGKAIKPGMGWRGLASKGLPRALGMGARLLPLGPIPMALLAGSMAWDKYKFNKSVAEKIDALRARGVVSEEDAQSMNTIYKQGWLGTTAIGAKILGSEELMLDGELADIDKQKEVLAKMKEFYEGREEKGKEFRAGERQEDFFDWFSQGGRVGLEKGGSPFGMTRRSFLKWLIGSIATGVAAVSGRGLKQAAKTATTTVAKTPAKFVGVEGMPAWFPRVVEMIKAKGVLKQLADKHYVEGDKYEIILKGKNIMMEEHPLTGEIHIQWNADGPAGEIPRWIAFRPGQAGYQKFGVDDADAAAQGITEYRRVKVEEPEFEYGQPDYHSMGPEDTSPDSPEFLDIFTEGDDVVKSLEDLAGPSKKEIESGVDVVEEKFRKKIYKDIEGEEAVIPEPEGVGISKEGEVHGEEGFKEIIEGEVPEHLKKKAEGGRVGMKFGGSWADWKSNHEDQMTFEEYLQIDMDKPVHPINKNAGGIIETGNIARRPGAVPPLSGPTPQGRGILGLFSSPKRVNIT